jgi:hypothetical protein
MKGKPLKNNAKCENELEHEKALQTCHFYMCHKQNNDKQSPPKKMMIKNKGM